MADNKIIEEWLTKVGEDFLYAKASLEEDLRFYSQISFHLHQAAEKYLKAYIIAKNLEFQKIHNLVKLVDICSTTDEDFSKLRDMAAELNPYYIESRYPGSLGSVTRDQIEEALKITEDIGTFVKSKIQSS